MSILIIKFCYKNSIDQLKITLLNVLSDVRMCEKYKIYYPYSIGPIVYKVMPELRGANAVVGSSQFFSLALLK